MNSHPRATLGDRVLEWTLSWFDDREGRLLIMLAVVFLFIALS